MGPSARSQKLVLVAMTIACLAACLASPAAAEFGPIELVSKSAKEQAGYAQEPALSGDGKYVAFCGELGGREGIFREELATDSVVPVATTLPTSSRENCEQSPSRAPSISAEGRYVSFTSTQSLVAADTKVSSKDVYVADLSSTPPTYELASSAEGVRMSGSSSAAPRVALSADGSEVAFVNENQVYVHRRGESRPILITVKRGGSTAEPAPNGGAVQNAGAALSADGNAVAWVGDHLPEQVPLLGSEEQKIRAIEKGPGEEIDKSNKYFEPLWRLVPTGSQNDPAADPTRRIVGGYDPLAPGCGGNTAEAACQGPFPGLTEDHTAISRANLPGPEGIGWGINLPQLSANGQTVAVIGSPEDVNDLFVVDMASGLSRVEAVRQLTKWTNPAPNTPLENLFEQPQDLAFLGPIKQCAISADGRYIAFTTERQEFALNPPTLITARPTAPPTVVELYQINLAGETIERVTPGPGIGVSAVPGGIETGAIAEARYGEAESGASGPSYSADDRILAFASRAYNLVAGDANQNSDVFTVESKPPSLVQQSTISSRPSVLSVHPVWRLTVHAISRPDGAVRIVAGVPGAGTLSAKAKSRVGSKSSPRKVSAGHRRSRSAGIVRLELNLPTTLQKLAHRKGGLYSALNVQFIGPGGKPLKQQLVARFRAHSKSSGKKARQG